MHIYCPKCNAGYEIDEQLIQDKSQRVKCSNCGEIFVADNLLFELAQDEDKSSQEDAFEMLHAAMSDNNEDENKEFVKQDAETYFETKDEAATEDVEVGQKFAEEEVLSQEKEEGLPQEKEENLDDNDSDENVDTAFDDDKEDNVDLESIFERLSEHTEHLMAQEKKLPVYEKIWLQIKNVLGFHFKIRLGYIISFAVVFIVLSLFNNRYQIVRELPFLNSFYKAFGINAKIPGEGLEFQNISWEFFEDEGMRLEIKGFISNNTDKNVELPIVHIEILDRNTALLQSLNREIDEDEVEANAKMPLDLVVENPAPTAKYVYLTFIEKD